MARKIPRVYVETVTSTPETSVATTNSAGFAGQFKKGYVGRLVSITSPTNFITHFGDSTLSTAHSRNIWNDWAASKFISSYTNNLFISRAIHYETAGSDNDKSAYFAWKRETPEYVYESTINGYYLPMTNDNTKQFFFADNLVLDVGPQRITSLVDRVPGAGYNWTLGSGWSLGTNDFTFTGAPNGMFPLTSSITLPTNIMSVSATTYKIQFEVTNILGTPTMSVTIGGVAEVIPLVTLGLQEYNITATGTTSLIISATGNTGNDVSISNISCRAVIADHINGCRFLGTSYSTATIELYDVIEVSTEYYMCKYEVGALDNIPSGDDADGGNSWWTHVSPGANPNLVYVKHANDTDTTVIFTDDTKEWQDLTTPSFIFQMEYHVQRILKSNKTGSPGTYVFQVTIPESETFHVSLGGLTISNSANQTATITVLSKNSIQFETTAIKFLNKKGDIFYINGVVETSTVSSSNPILFYSEDITSESLTFETTFENYGSCVGMYNVFDENFRSNLNLGILNDNGIVAFAKSPGDWGNEISCLIFGREYWESENNIYTYLKPDYEMKSHELWVLIFENGILRNKYLTTVKADQLSENGTNYFIEDVINNNSKYVSLFYTGTGVYEELETGDEINNILKSGSESLGNWKIVRTEVPAALHTEDETYNYVVEIIEVDVPGSTVKFRWSSEGGASPTLVADDVVDVQGWTWDASPATNPFFIHNGYKYEIVATGSPTPDISDIIAGNWVKWNHYAIGDVSGIRVTFQLANGRNSNSINASDIATAYEMFNNPDINPILVSGGIQYSESDMRTINQRIMDRVINVTTDVHLIANVPYSVFNNLDVADAIKNWGTVAFGTTGSNDKMVVYAMYTSCIVDNKKIILPVNFLLLNNHLRVWETPGRWTPIAGNPNGVVGGYDSVLWYPKEDEDIIKLQDVSVNPIILKRGSGYVVNEVKNMKRDGSIECEANVVFMRDLLQSELQIILDPFIFNGNVSDQIDKTRLSSAIDNYLKTYLRRGAFQSFTTSLLTSDELFTDEVEIKIVPNETRKFIVLRFKMNSPRG